MDLWTWVARVVIKNLQDRFQHLEAQRDALADLAKRAHEDASGGCDGVGNCKFCDRHAAILRPDSH